MPYATIDSPNKHFDTTTYTANGGSQTITNSGSMQPDFFWGKVRSTTSNHILINSIVGVSKYLYSNTNGSEVTDANYFTSFNSNGFSVGSNNYSNGTTMVAWQWKGGGTGVSNTSGTISSTVSANTTSGFSIVSWTGTGSALTVGHGLGSTPQMIIVKNRDSGTSNWVIYNYKLGSSPQTAYMYFATGGIRTGYSGFWNSTAPTSSVFSIGTDGDINSNGQKMIAYCFASIKGYSKFDSYTGNGNADGTFVYTGFKPAFIIFKRTDSDGYDWCVYDNKRDPRNVAQQELYTNLNIAEGVATNNMDFLSNGFKPRRTSAGVNASGGTYIYMAFAENPFVSSKGIPTTAR